MRNKLVSIDKKIAERAVKPLEKPSTLPACSLQRELLDLIAEIIAHDLCGQGEKGPKELCHE
jgi:hypothetical protein